MKKLLKDKLVYLIASLSIYAIILLAIRIKITNSFYYLFLVWNLFLAYIPYGISTLLKHNKMLQNSTLKLWSLLSIWLLFLPNAPYIITDLFHLEIGKAMPRWFDLLLIISFAVNGYLLFFISINDVHTIIKKRTSNIKTWILTISVFFLCGFGIYLGRFLRWNSWDIVQKPVALFIDIINRIANPIQHPKTWGVTLGFGIFFTISFIIFKLLITQNKLNHDL